MRDVEDPVGAPRAHWPADFPPSTPSSSMAPRPTAPQSLLRLQLVHRRLCGLALLGLNESLSMTENLAVVNSTNPALPAGSTFLVNDRFGTSNLFNGGQIGAIGEYRIGRFSFDLRTSLGLGGTQQFVNVSGSTMTAGPGILPTTSPGGLLALSSNIGPHTRTIVELRRRNRP